jgi:hypothetical protein
MLLLERARGRKAGGEIGLRFFPLVLAGKSNADSFAANVLPVIEKIKASGVTSLRAIAAAVLDARGVPTARGGKWAATQVRDIFVQGGLMVRCAPGENTIYQALC